MTPAYTANLEIYRHLFCLVIFFPERSCQISSALCALPGPGIVLLTSYISPA